MIYARLARAALSIAKAAIPVGLAFLLFIYITGRIEQKVAYDVKHTLPELATATGVSELHLYRFVVSTRRAYPISPDGSLGFYYPSPNDKRVDYVTVSTVDAYIQLAGVRFEEAGSDCLRVILPPIEVKQGNIDESASFIWRQDAEADLSSISLVAEHMASARAEKLGIRELARQSAERFFTGMLLNLGYARVDVVFAPEITGTSPAAP